VTSNSARLAAGYFVYFGAIGIFTPFWSPYLALRGFDSWQIGLLLAASGAARVIGPLVIGWIADASGRPTRILRLTVALSAAIFALLPVVQGLAGFLALTVLFSFCWNSFVPLYDAHTLAHLGEQRARYGLIRLWGSVGFIVLSWAGGAAFEHSGYEAMPLLMFALITVTLLMTLATAAMTPAATVPGAQGFRAALRSRDVIVALVVAALVGTSFGPYYVFFSLYLEQHGYSRGAIGFLWALGVIAEIGVFAYGRSLLGRFSIRMLFVLAAAGSALRWAAIGLFVEHPIAIALAQLLHCLGFAVLHLAMVLTAQRMFPRGLESRGQALFSGMTYGVGGALGSVLAGLTWSAFSPRASYLGAAFIVVLAALYAALGLRAGALDYDGAGALDNESAGAPGGGSFTVTRRET
jgi:PPP family 3-phenylpropionic acid transporter